MLRTTALALLLANGAYFAWSQGLLAPVGLAPSTAREPQRMAQQIRPEALTVVPATSATPAPEPAAPAAPAPAAAAEPAAAPTACLQAGPFDAAQADILRKALAAAGLPGAAWALEAIAPPERWIVYMGRYTDADTLEKKRAELRALRVETAPITQAALAPGLSLGVFSTQESANEHLAQLARRGVRTARVVSEHRESTSARLRLPAADSALREQVQQLGPALAGRPLTPC
ncbi:SPOR domain-containing protein [Pseudorhodoferax sp.]|uniref:SPOR domain-containing protein n=1 Tax=Pseudorhodoferax sp. TaxID=1993553 RepID=UPI002DD67FE0|nr:SPOR domain-containing protein [Pseudorhodoferax sp.]